MSLLKSSGVVAFMTMLSRILGLVRDIVIAAIFGAGSSADAFFVAFKIPNFLRRLFAEGAFSQAFVPVLSEYRQQQPHEEVQKLVNAVSGTLGVVLLILTVAAMAGAPYLTMLFAPGFIDEPEKFNQASDMLRITFPYLFLISLTAFSGAILNAYGRFAVPAFTPVLLNLSLISVALFMTPLMSEPILALAWGVLIAGMMQLFVQLPFLMRLNLLPRPRIDYRHEGVMRILKLMTPALFGVSVSQVNLLLDTILASFLQTGSVSWLYYSDRLSELPLGVIGIAIGTVILPSLSRSHTAQSKDQFSATMNWALRLVFLIGLPAAAALIVLAEPLLITLFFYGEMTPRDVLMSSQSLMAYALGLQAFMLIKILAPGYFARQDTKTPVKIGIVAMAANMIFNLLLIWHFAHVGLALATSISAWLNAALLWIGLRRGDVQLRTPGLFMVLVRIVFALAVMMLFIFWAMPSAAEMMQFSVWQRVIWMSVLVLGGLIAYFGFLFLAGLRVRHLKR
ncbi:MAG: murein biosynthesis integral membrane protein MurJ [Pseudomonadales bacterium]|nr:murein biosynthesis integral membrane protein MurJ [Pseudomonadales bacterium]